MILMTTIDPKDFYIFKSRLKSLIILDTILSMEDVVDKNAVITLNKLHEVLTELDGMSDTFGIPSGEFKDKKALDKTLVRLATKGFLESDTQHGIRATEELKKRYRIYKEGFYGAKATLADLE